MIVTLTIRRSCEFFDSKFATKKVAKNLHSIVLLLKVSLNSSFLTINASTFNVFISKKILFYSKARK